MKFWKISKLLIHPPLLQSTIMDSKTAWNELKIGVLALQGAFSEHLVVFKSLSVSAIPVKTPADLAQVHGLVIPGGESTTIIKLCERNGLVGEIQEFIKNGRPVWGICAGLILLAKEATHGKGMFISSCNESIQANF